VSNIHSCTQGEKDQARPFRKKWYNESLKAYRIYIPGQRQIEVSRDVTFEEDISFKRSRGCNMEIDPIDFFDPVDPVDVPIYIAVGQKRTTRAWETLQEEKGYAASHGTFRVSKITQIYSCYAKTMSHIIHFEPSYDEEEIIHPVWRDVMMEEYQYIMKNDMWDIIMRPEGKSVVTSRWIYNIKHTVDKSIQRHKTRFVSRVFSQVEGIDYEEKFSPIARYTSIRMIISPSTSMGYRVHHMDVKKTFVNGEIEEEIYIKQPYGFIIHEKESHVCRLKMVLYGLKKPPRDWYARIDGHLMIFGLQQKFCRSHPVLQDC
jgi:hypothetical protein